MLFVVAAALVDIDGRVLLAQRPEGKSMAGLWEFPGGKVGADETPEDALSRELKEELGIRTCRTCFSPASFVTWPVADNSIIRLSDDPKDGHGSSDHRIIGSSGCDPNLDLDPDDPESKLLLLLYICRRWVGTPHPHEGQALKWVYPKDMKNFTMPPADTPLVRQLMELL